MSGPVDAVATGAPSGDPMGARRDGGVEESGSPPGPPVARASAGDGAVLDGIGVASRVVGLLLVVLLPLHVVATVVLVDLSELTSYRVDGRWESPALRALDWLVLVLALCHGALALHPRLAAVRSPARRLAGEALLVSVTVAALLLVTSVVGTYSWP